MCDCLSRSIMFQGSSISKLVSVLHAFFMAKSYPVMLNLSHSVFVTRPLVAICIVSTWGPLRITLWCPRFHADPSVFAPGGGCAWECNGWVAATL